MRRRFDLHSLLRRLAAAMACAFAVAAGAADEPAHEVKAPHYGDTLFHFFQDHYFGAITVLMVSQHFERVAPHSDEAEVLRGGMLLSYGLQREAGEIFAQLIERGASPTVRDRAWFYLATIRYQRGYLADAEAAIAHVEDHLPPALEEERGLLQAHLLMARDDHRGAAEVLSRMNGKTPGARYVRYNLGIALIKAGDAARGRAVLDELGRADAENEEYRSLRDRANVALGFAALTEDQPRAARGYLERVRLKSPQANKALLGFGWAADAMKEPKLALVPWTELAQRDITDSAALEAQIAVPYAYAELGAFGQSLDRYNDAIAAFEREDVALDEAIQAVRSGRFLDALIERNPGDEMGWFWRLGELPELPQAGHLAPVLAQHEFQEAFKNYRDLLFLAKNLQDWRDKLVVFDDMLATRRKAYAERLPQVRACDGEIGLDAFRRRLDGVSAEVAQGEAVAAGLAFADARQTALLHRLAEMRTRVEWAGATPEIEPVRERMRLAAGALTWQLAQQYPERLWSAKKELATIAGQLAQAERRDAALAEAQRDEPARFERFGRRIAAFEPILQTMIPKVAALGQEQRAAVQSIAVAELTKQKTQLAAYAMQARFAVAQLYDRANLGKEAVHAAGP
jgi:hypothetical protein